MARVIDSSGAPVGNAVWEIRKHADLAWQRVTESRRTTASGQIFSCLRYERGDLIEFPVSRPGRPPFVEFDRLVRQPTTVTITVPDWHSRRGHALWPMTLR